MKLAGKCGRPTWQRRDLALCTDHVPYAPRPPQRKAPLFTTRAACRCLVRTTKRPFVCRKRKSLPIAPLSPLFAVSALSQWPSPFLPQWPTLMSVLWRGGRGTLAAQVPVTLSRDLLACPPGVAYFSLAGGTAAPPWRVACSCACVRDRGTPRRCWSGADCCWAARTYGGGAPSPACFPHHSSQRLTTHTAQVRARGGRWQKSGRDRQGARVGGMVEGTP